MASLGETARRIRSKNAGPFWLTVDIFCGTAEAFARIRDGLHTKAVARAFDTDPALIKRFDIDTLSVVKFSLPRPVIQGSIDDRDMHAAGYGWLLHDVEIDGD